MNTQDSPAIARRAQAIYEQRLKTLLESSHWGEFVAIEPDSGDYFLGGSLSEAIRAARQAHPDRVGFAMRVGSQTTVQIGETQGSGVRFSVLAGMRLGVYAERRAGQN